jgi:integrase
MAKPYSIFKARNGIYYVQFRLSDGSRSSSKSTGCRNKTEAERKAMEWVVNGQIPARINSKNESESFTSVDKIKFLNDLRTTNFSEEDIKSIVNILKERKFITSAVIHQSPEDKPIEDFLLTFWDFEKSPYVKEKKLKSQSIHQSYCATMKSRVEIYWIPMLKGRSIGSITRKDVQAIFENEIVLKLAPKTINSIVSSITVPLKWAFYNELTENNCFDGILKCGQKSKTRDILTLEQAAAVFKIPWENDSAKLANMLALYTGMRQGEIAGLQLQDIGVDRIYIRHSWSKYEGLKETKTNESREIKIPPKVRDDLLMQASFNPYNEGQSGFVFFGLLPKQPTDPKNWLKYFRRALKESGHPAPNKICFHAWRHLWCSRVKDLISDNRVIMTGSGHKTETMLNHYSEHVVVENALDKLEKVQEKLFLPIIEAADVEYSFCDE